MQLILAKTTTPYIPSAKYLTLPSPSVERFELKTVTLPIYRSAFLTPLSIANLYKGKVISENSIILQGMAPIRELENLYTLDNSKEIENFLLNNDYLIEILLEAPGHIYRIFGQVPIHLEHHRDPEEGWDELFIVIKSSYNAKEALELERKLAEEWFLTRLKDTRGQLNIIEEPL